MRAPFWILAAALLCACGEARPSPPAAIPPAQFDPRPYVSIYGQVQRPGRYRMIAPTTIVQLIVAAEGFTPLAWRGDVILRRRAYDGRNVAMRVNVDAIVEGKATDIPLYPGDVVFVGERTF